MDLYFNKNRKQFRLITLYAALILFIGLTTISSAQQGEKWVGTWSTAPQLVETQNNPPEPGLANNTLRQVVRVSIGGDSLRMRFTNEFSNDPVTMNSVHIAVSNGLDTIDVSTDTEVLFGGNSSVTMEAGEAVMSDPFNFVLKPLSDLVVTIYYGNVSSTISGHPGSRTTSYIMSGNEVSRGDFSDADATTDHWYNINTIEVMAPDSAYAVAILGNSITDGRGSTTNGQNRWPDELSKRLQANPATQQIGILNQGIGGNAVLSGGLGPYALSRFYRDIIDQNGVKWLVIFEGVNDIGGAFSGTQVADDLITAYEQMINTAHANDIYVYGATIMPFNGNSYYSEDHELARQTVNNWIRNSGRFDAIIDFDKAMRDPADTTTILDGYHDGDYLHPSVLGHHMMAEAVDLSLFTKTDSLSGGNSGQVLYYEPECTDIGINWDVVESADVSGDYYVTVNSALESVDSAPASADDQFTITFNADADTTYYLSGRLNCPSYNDDSFWIKMDDGEFEMVNNLTTSGWSWVNMSSYELAAGEHTLTVAYRENGALMDKLCITNSLIILDGLGGTAENICTITAIENDDESEVPSSFLLEQNYPNPFNPTTTIKYTIQTPPKSSPLLKGRTEVGFVQLRIYNLLGQEVATLVNEQQPAGNYKVKFDASHLSSGVYIYQIKTSGFISSKKMLLIK